MGPSRKNLLTTILALTVLLVAAPLMASVVITEVDYDQVGTDTTEWLELHNPGSTPLSLVGLDLVFLNGSGGGCAEYGRFPLDAITIAAGGYVVIGNHACATSLVTIPASNAIQNGAPDGIVIEDRNSLAIVDGVEYENVGAANCGGVATDAADANLDPLDSIQLCDGAWIVAVGTPCLPTACGPVSTSDSSWGAIKSRF